MRQSDPPRRQLTVRHPAASAVAAATAAVLLAGCGSVAATGSGAGPDASGSPAPCGTPTPTPSAPGAAQPTALAQGGVRITSVGPTCFAYEATNPNAEPYDVTVVFSLRSPEGAALDNLTRTVAGIAPGATGKGSVDLTATPPPLGEPVHPPRASPTKPGAGSTKPGARPVKPEILQVRSVPTAEAPSTGGPCPPSGLRLYADEGDAAMGLRALGVHLRNCGTATVTLDGYPQVQPLDADHRPLDGVRVLRGGAEIATGTGADDPPRTFDLKPGEGARSTLVWRNTVDAVGEPQHAPYARVRANAGAAPVMITPELDLGTTGRLGAGAWVKEDPNEPTPAPRGIEPR
ncbi:DUF4232 domain-containing protein [Kitasatospora sp. NPDC004799]|uniref:DUF4232 domain-containing protein n=1 Tax=Kitasatospora sp. NPDC004799 TaxID=3154460 RepID=UPI0033BDDEA9